MLSGFSLVTFVVFLVGLIVLIKAIRVVPQQRAWIVERLGRFHAVLEPGLNVIWPFFDRVAYKHDLREIPLDVPPQVCITKDNTQLQVDGILYFQVTDPMRASYGSSNYIVAVTPLHCLAMSGPTVEGFLVAHPRVMYRMLQAQARRLRNANRWRS